MAEWYSGQRPFILGHRGASAAAPENTMAAFHRAQELGADGIEFDVQLSADGVPVIFHDRTVDRVTGGSGVVSQMTLAELQSLEAGDGQTIPTLDDLFTQFGAAFLYNVELKSYSGGDGDLAAAVADRILGHQLANQSLVSSFNPWILRRIRRHLPKQVPIAHLHYFSRGRYKYWLQPCEAIHPHFRLVDEAYMAWARRHQWLVNVWTVDDPQEVERLTRLGVTAIIRNVID